MAKEKLYLLKVWTRSTTPTTYKVKEKPLLGRPTNDVGIEFTMADGRILIISSNCRWVLEEN